MFEDRGGQPETVDDPFAKIVALVRLDSHVLEISPWLTPFKHRPDIVLETTAGVAGEVPVEGSWHGPSGPDPNHGRKAANVAPAETTRTPYGS